MVGYHEYAVASFSSFTLSAESENLSEKLKSLVNSLPLASKSLVIYLLSFLGHVAANSAANKMTAANLSIIFGPILLPPKKTQDSSSVMTLVKKLIEEYAPKAKVAAPMSPRTKRAVNDGVSAASKRLDHLISPRVTPKTVSQTEKIAQTTKPLTMMEQHPIHQQLPATKRDPLQQSMDVVYTSADMKSATKPLLPAVAVDQDSKPKVETKPSAKKPVQAENGQFSNDILTKTLLIMEEKYPTTISNALPL